MAQWHDITRDPEYKSLSDAAKLEVKRGFFDRVIAADPEFSSLSEDGRRATFQEFMQTPDDTGQGYVSSMLGSAGRGFGEMVPGAIEGVGALTGSEGLRETGQDIRSGLESISPVNPVYQESIPVKLSGLGGQIGSVIATAGAGGAVGKALGGVGAVSKGAQTAALGSAFLQGSAEGAREAEQYGMEGPEAYLRTLAGGVIEAGSEFIPFGLGAETALAKRVLSGAPRTGTFLGSVGSEAGEEGIGQLASNVATQALAPAGVETPGVLSGALEAAAYGAVGGGMLGGVNALISTPPDKQTDIQRNMAAEVGAIPKDTVPDQTNEEKVAAMNAGGVTVVDPEGRTAVIAPTVEPEISMQPPEIALKVGEASAQNLAATGNAESAIAQDDFNQAAAEVLPPTEPAVQSEQKVEAPEPEVTPSLPETEMQSVVDQEAPAGTPVQAAPISPENLQSALDEHTSGPKTPEQDWQFAVSMPEGVWIEDGLGGRMRKKSYRIKKSGSEEIEFEHQVFNEETGKWEDNPSAYAFMSKKKDGSLSVNNQFPSPLQPASYTEISTGERKISKPIVVLPSQQPATTQEDAVASAPVSPIITEAPLSEGVEENPVEIHKKRNAVAESLIVRDAEGGVNRAETRKKVKEAAEKAGLTVDEFTDAQAAANIKANEDFFNALNEGDVLEWTDANGRKETGRVEVGLNGKKTVRNTTEGSSAQDYQYTSKSGIFSQVADTLKVIRKNQKSGAGEAIQAPTLDELVAAGLPQDEANRLVRAWASDTEPGTIPSADVIAKRYKRLKESEKDAETIQFEKGVSLADHIENLELTGIPKKDIQKSIVKDTGLDIDDVSQMIDAVRRFRGIPQKAGQNAAGIQIGSNDAWIAWRDAKIHSKGGSANIQPLTTPPNKRKVEDMKDILDSATPASRGPTTPTAQTPETGKSSGQRDTSKPEQMTPGEYASSERDPELPKNYVLSDGNGNFVTEEKNGWFKVWRLTGTHATLAGTVGFKGAEGLAKAKARLKEVSAEMHEEKLQNGIRTKKPVSKAAVDTYGITLPEGYVQDGELYVYRPSGTVEAVSEPVPPAKPRPMNMAGQVRPEKKSRALERQRKLDERLRQSLNSIIDKEKTNIVQGTVSKADAEFARRTLNNSGEIPNAFLTRVYASPEEFLADKGNQRLFPSSYSRLQSESNIEGLFERGQTLIFADKIGVSDLDRRIGKNLGISPQQAAARRVIAHENGHRGVGLFTSKEKREFLGYLRRKYTDEQVDNLVRVYTEYADWRTNLESRNEALEELFLKDFERLEKIPTGGIWDDIVEFLKRVWRRLTGRKGDPTLQDMKDVVRLLRNAMRRTAVPSFTTKDGGEVKLSLSDRFQGVTPEQDAEYLAAVQAGDMETAQRMVDEAAKAAGYDAKLFHGTNKKFTSFSKDKINVNENKSNPLSGGRGLYGDGFYFTPDKRQAGFYGKRVMEVFVKAKNPLVLSDDSALDNKQAKESWAGKITQDFKDYLASSGTSLDRAWDKISAKWREASGPLGKEYARRSEARRAEVYGFDAIFASQDTIDKSHFNEVVVFDPNQIKSADPVTYDDAGNVIPLSQRFQTASPDIRFSRVEYASDYQAAVSAGAQLARDTVYDDRIIEMRDAIRRAYEQSSTEAGVAMPIDELYAKANAITPMSESDFGNILQDLYEDNGAVLQDGATQISGEPLASTQNLEKDNPFNELIRKSSSKSPSIGEINSVSKKFITRFIRPDSSFARQNDIRIDGNATLQARALPDGGIVIGYSLSQDSFDGLQKMAPQAASQYTKDAAIEELIHLSDLIGLRNQWLKSGKQIPFDQFVLNEQSNLAFSLIQQADSMSDSEAESLRKILASSLSLYDNNADIAKLGLNELLDLAAQNSFVLPELIRSLIQLKKTGQITETAFRKIANVLRQWQETVLQWLVDGYSSARDGVFGEMLSERIKNAEANLEILSGNTFDVFTPEGRRAGFAVIMPKRAVASRVETEGPAFDAYRKTVEAINENSLNAFSKARPMKGASPQVHTVKSSKSYEQAAIELVNDLAKDGTPIEDIAESLFSDEFLQGLGIKLDIPALVSLIAEVKNRVSNQSRDDKIPGARRVKLQKLDRKLAGYWQDLGTNSGRSQGIRSYITRNPRYRWMFIFDKAEEQLRKDRELAATRVASDLPQTADNLQKTDAKIAEETDEQVADDVEQFAESEDDTLLREGETALDSGRRSIWERMKDVLRKLALVARARKGRAANAAKASISKEERDAISQMSDAELAKMESDLLSEFDRLSEAFLKGGTEQQKATRKKMVATAKKRAEQGKPIEVTSVNTADVIDGIFVGFNDRDSIINEVGDALLKAAEQRKVKPKQKTAIQDLIAAIRQTLTANLKGEQIKADQPSLGKLLGKTFAQQGSEAALFAKSWEDGRKKVRAMLADMGVDEASLDEELDAIMPPTPTLAYAPAAAKKAINVAIKEAGLTPQDALSNPAFFRESIMAKFNEAAEKDNLTEEGWNQSGKALAEKAINEFIDNARIKAEKRSAESKAKMEKRKVEIADKRASQLIYSVEERFRQGSKDLQTSKSGDSINKAFRDQVKDPVSKFEFFQRLAKLNVSQDVSERLFRTAAREKADLKAMEAFRRLEGPNALQTMLREISALRPGEQAPLSKQIPWRKLLSQKASTVEIYRQRIFDAISSEESLAGLDEAQKAKLADLFTQAWESKRKAILDRMVDNAINQEEAAGRLTKEGADALRSQRQKLVEDINLGILDEERLMKHLADKFGIKSEFTEAERANIDRLLDILQDDKLNEVKRNKAAYELLGALSSATKIPIAKLLADYWVSSVLSGVNTAASIAMAVMSGGYELTTGAFRILRAGFTNPKELPAEIAASFKAMAEFLKAFGREGRLAWQYLVTGDRAFLDPSMNTVLNDLNYDSIGKTVSLAEKMAKSDKLTEKVMGIWMRSVSRLLTALDSFNSGVTKAGALPIVFRQLDLSAEALKQATEKYNLQLYRDKVIQRDFNGNKPTTAHDKALVDSYAKAEMMADLQEFGKFSENADFFGQQGAMTLDPTGFGGFIYSSIKSLTGGATNRADKFLAEAEREWKQADGADKTAKGLQLAFAYFLQFGAYNSANLAGLRFARFAGNKFNQGLSFIPGIGMFRMYEATVKDSKIEAKEAFTDMILRNQTAGLLFAIIGGMALKAITDEPDDEKRGWFINGGWANLTPDRKQQKLAAGQKEFTIGIGGKVYNYQNWPISPILAAIGSLSDLIRFSPEQWNEKSVIGRLGSAAASGVFSAGEIPALSGFQTLFGNNLSSKDPNEKRLDRFAKVMAGWGGGFVPRILKDIDFMADPGLRKYETLWEQTASHIPVYRRYSGEEYYDILGKQIERKVRPGSREFMELESAPEYRTLGKLNSRGIWLTPANAEHRMVGKGRNKRKLTQEEADAYSLETGKGYRQMLLRYGSRLEQMPTERARAFLMDKADEVRDRALKKIVR